MVVTLLRKLDDDALVVPEEAESLGSSLGFDEDTFTAAVMLDDELMT